MDEKVKRFYAKVEKYGGWQDVPADRVHSIITDVLRPIEMGFALAKRGYWARQIDSDIFHVIKLDALKGGAYGLSYGLSLSYVPYPYVPKVKWHKTLKSVSLDLFEQPQVHLVGAARPHGDAELCVASALMGERCFREELETGWARCSSMIRAWFDATQNVIGVLDRCNEHLARDQAGVRYFPGARLVRAFTYARMDRRGEAKTELDTFLDEYGEGDQARANLYHALEQIEPR